MNTRIMKPVLAFIFMVMASTMAYTQETPFVEGEIMVMLKNDHKINNLVKEIRNDHGITSFRYEKCLNEYMGIWLLSFDSQEVDSYQLKGLVSQSDEIKMVQFNHYVSQRETIPTDDLFDDQWHHIESADHDIDSELAWDITTGGTNAFGEDIVVCVIEGGGSDYEHEDLIDNHWTNEAEIPDNGVDDDGNGYVDDYNGWNPNGDNDNVPGGNHGTAVSSMIGAKGNNDIGVSGVNWDVKIMQVTVGSLTEANVIEAYAYPMKLRMMYNESSGSEGAFVVATNASWGIDFGQPDDSPMWCAYYDSLGVQGILNCGATANNNVDIDAVGDLPTGCGSDYMISVTATNSSDVRTFSGYGATTVDLGAPGESVFLASNTDNYSSTSGTSFASPCVAGAVALLYSAPCPSFMAIAQSDPQFAADMIREYIFDGVDEVDNLEGECVTGGRLNVNNSLLLMMDECQEDGCLIPFGVGFNDLGEGDLELTWNGLESMESYDLRYRAIGADMWTVMENLEVTSMSFEELEWCTEYEFQLASDCGKGGESEWSVSYTYLTDGCCVAPDAADIQIDETTETTIELSWPFILAADNYEIEYRIEGSSDWTSTTSFDTEEFTLDGLEPCTFYEVQVNLTCLGGEIVSSETLLIRTRGCGACVDNSYCDSYGEDASEEWIESITIGSFTNVSGNNDGYVDFTDEDGIVFAQGGVYDIVLTPGFDGASFNEYWKIWIDLDQDEEFEEGELIYDSDGGTDEVITGSVTIPSGTEEDNLKMRVVMRYVGNFGFAEAEPCGDYNYGETEDYCVSIQGVASVNDISTDDIAVFPNPAGEVLNIAAGTQTIERFRLFDASGRLIKDEMLFDQQAVVNIADVSTGMYIYEVNLEGDFSVKGQLFKK